MRIILPFLFLFFLFVSVVSADPSVSGTSGNIQDGQTLTINGSGFGTKSTAAPQIWDNMETGSFNSSWETTTSLSINTTNQRHSNSTYNGHHRFDSGGYAVFRGGNVSEKWYAQYWVRLDPNWEWGTTYNYSGDDRHLANVKFFRLWNPGSINENWVVASKNLNNSCIALTEYVSPVEVNYFWSTFHSDITDGNWHLLQFEFKENSALGVGDGEFRLWFDGELKLEDLDIESREDFSEYKRPFILGFYNSWGPNTGLGETVSGNDNFYIDDAYIDGTFARVEIGNASTYDACTHREIQIPTSWSASSVEVTLNRGSFGENDTSYLYVTDSDGAVNSAGYEITWGEAGPTDTQDPTLQSYPTEGLSNVATSLGIDLTISDNVSLDNSTFVVNQRINGGTNSNIASNFVKQSSSTTETWWRYAGASYSNSDSVTLNVLTDDNSANSMDLTRSFSIIAAENAPDRFFTGDPGTRANYTEENASRWDTLTEVGNNVVYSVITTDFSGDAGDVPGEVNYFSNKTYQDFEIDIRVRQDDSKDPEVNLFPDFQIYWAVQDTSNFYGLEASYFAGQSHAYEISGGAKTNVIEWVDGEQTTNTQIITDSNFHNYKLRSSNGQLTFYVNGDLRLSTDVTQTRGFVGFGTYNDAATFDNVTITDLTKQTTTINTSSGTTSASGSGSITIN